MKAIILARVSTKEQEEGHSIDAQLDRLKGYCERKNLSVIKTCKIIESSTRGERKDFNALLDFAKSQKEKIAIVADAVDRIQRSFKESVSLDILIRSEKIELHFYREGMIIGSNASSSDIMRWDFSVMGAKAYVLQLSENVKRSLEFKRKNGEWGGQAPIGYLNTIDPQTGKRTVTIDSERAPIIKKLFEEYASGNSSINQLTDKAIKWGLTNNSSKRRAVCRSHVHKLLNNPFYCGVMIIKGEKYPHKYERIIPPSIFELCKRTRAGYKKQPTKLTKEPFVFRGIISCKKCGCAISPEIKKCKYIYLRPTRSKGPGNCEQITENDAIKVITDVLLSLKTPEPMMKFIRQSLLTTAQAEEDFHTEAVGSLHEEYNQITSKLSRLLEMRLNNEISKDQFELKQSELKDRQNEINETVAKHTQADEVFASTLSTLIDLSFEAYELFESSNAEEKRRILKFLFSNLQLNGSKLEYTLKKPFFYMQNMTDHPRWLTVVDTLRTDYYTSFNYYNDLVNELKVMRYAIS